MVGNPMLINSSTGNGLRFQMAKFAQDPSDESNADLTFYRRLVQQKSGSDVGFCGWRTPDIQGTNFVGFDIYDLSFKLSANTSTNVFAPRIIRPGWSTIQLLNGEFVEMYAGIGYKFTELEGQDVFSQRNYYFYDEPLNATIPFPKSYTISNWVLCCFISHDGWLNDQQAPASLEASFQLGPVRRYAAFRT